RAAQRRHGAPAPGRRLRRRVRQRRPRLVPQADRTAERPSRVVTAAAPFGEFVARAQARGALVVQPRMGFSDPALMRAGLSATKAAAATTVGTLTLDSYTRVGDDEA